MHTGTHLSVLSKSFPMITNMTGFIWFSKMLVSVLVPWKKVASASGGSRFVANAIATV